MEPDNGSVVNQLASRGVREAVPLLKERFSALPNNTSGRSIPEDRFLLKEQWASALVRFGDKDNQYWNYLVTQAKVVTENDVPFPIVFDSEGKGKGPGQYSPEFFAWVKSHGVSAETEAANQVYGMMLRLYPLAATGDSRGIPILEKALKSQNVFVQGIAAKGLARAGAVQSIPLIIEMCAKAIPSVADQIAESLVFFDAPRAKQAAERFVRNKAVLEELRGSYRKDGPAGLFK